MKRMISLGCVLLCLGFVLTGCTKKPVSSTVSSRKPSSVQPTLSPTPPPTSTGSSTDSGMQSTGSGVLSDIGSMVSGVVSGTMEGLSHAGSVLKEAFGDFYYPDTQLSGDELTEKLSLPADLYDDIYAETSKDPARPDVLVVVKAKEGKTDEVREALEKYRTTLTQNTVFDNNARLKAEAGEVYTQGDYVVLMVLGDTDDATLTGDGLSGAYKESMARGKEALTPFLTGSGTTSAPTGN